MHKETNWLANYSGNFNPRLSDKDKQHNIFEKRTASLEHRKRKREGTGEEGELHEDEELFKEEESHHE